MQAISLIFSEIYELLFYLPLVNQVRLIIYFTREVMAKNLSTKLLFLVPPFGQTLKNTFGQ